MKKNYFYSLFTALMLVAVCGVFASCGDDDDDPTTPGGGGSSKQLTEAKFTYGILINKDAIGFSDLTVTMTPSNGNPVTQTLTANNGQDLTNMSTMLQNFLGGLLGQIGADRDKYYLYTLPVTVKQFPSTVKVEYQWNVKSGYQVDDDAKYTVTIGSCYSAEANTGQTLNVNTSIVSTTTSGKKLSALVTNRATKFSKTYTFSVLNNQLSVE